MGSSLEAFMFVGYVLVPIALVQMFVKFKVSTPVWFVLLFISLFIGIAPLIALAYLFSNATYRKKAVAEDHSPIKYNTDGSYVAYKAQGQSDAPSLASTTLHVVGGAIATLAITFGLIIVGFIIFVSVILSANGGGGGGSKTM